MLYNDIADFPIYNWNKCIETKDYTWCLIERKECNENESIDCMQAFSDMYAQYIDTFGISDQLSSILSLQNQITVHKIDMALSGDGTIETFIDIKQLELDKLLEVKEVKGNSAKVAIERMMGFQINERTTSVKSYYEYINELKNSNGRTTD